MKEREVVFYSPLALVNTFPIGEADMHFYSLGMAGRQPIYINVRTPGNDQCMIEGSTDPGYVVSVQQWDNSISSLAFVCLGQQQS